MEIKKIKKAIIPAAGMGTRFLPATKAMPKEMLPIVDKPTIQFIVEEAVKAGIEEILIVVSSSKNSIIDHFDYSYELEERLKSKNKFKEYEEIRKIADMINIHYIRQKEPMGLGHAILASKSFIANEPFAVLLGDDIVIQEPNSNLTAIGECMDLYYQKGCSVVGVQEVEHSEVSKYGIVDPKDVFDSITKSVKLKGMVEKPEPSLSPSNYAILGRYILTPSIFDELEKVGIGIRGEIEITGALLELSRKEDVYAKIFSGKRYDIGSKLGYLQATIDIALKNKELKKPLLDYMVRTLKKEINK